MRLIKIVEGRGNGYIGKSMSVNAYREYDYGNMPLSKWTKDEILDAFLLEYEYLGVDISKLTREEMIKNLLERKAWHHTGAFYNVTDFYGLRDLSGLTQEYIDNIISKRQRNKKSEQEKEADKLNRNLIDETNRYLRKYEIIYKSGVLKYKTLAGEIRGVSIDELDSIYENALQFIKKKDAGIVSQWEKLPADHWRQKYVLAYNSNIDEYVNLVYPVEYKQNSKEYKLVKSKLEDML